MCSIFFLCQTQLILLYDPDGERETAKHAAIKGSVKTKAKKKPADTYTANPSSRIKLSVGQRLLRSELNRISPEERHPMMHVNPKVVLMKADGDCFDHPVKHFCSERMSRTGAS